MDRAQRFGVEWPQNYVLTGAGNRMEMDQPVEFVAGECGNDGEQQRGHQQRQQLHNER